MKNDIKYISSLCLITLASTFDFLIIDMKNLLLIGLLPISTLIYLNSSDRIVIKINDKSLSLFLLILFILLSNLINFHSIRLSSFLYSYFFIFLFIFVTEIFQRSKNKIQFINILKFIIIIFFIELILQQFSHILGLRISINNSVYVKNTLSRMPSLSLEPSLASTVVACSYYAYLDLMKERKDYNIYRDKALLFIFFYQIIFYSSVYGIASTIILILKHFKLFKKSNYFLPTIGIGVIAVIAILFLANTHINVFNRIDTLFHSQSIEGISSVDHSGSIRILPIYYYIMNFNILDIHTIFGHGIDYASNLYYNILSGIPEGAQIAGLIPSFLFDNGLLCFVIFIYFIRNFALEKFFSFDLAFLLLIMTNSGFNTQFVWFAITIFTLKKIYIQRSLSDKETNIQASTTTLLHKNKSNYKL